jgi:SAM-dependent methyltransferase
VFAEGLWQPRSIGHVSYPGDGNEACFQVEDRSYWFRHRNACILATVQRHSPGGPIYDVGGGNGFVSQALQAAGHEVVLVEPGPGALNGRRRGIRTVVRSTLADAAFEPGSIDAVGIFDVVEHVENDVAFLAMIHDVLKPRGLVYCTVPASPWLWSRRTSMPATTAATLPPASARPCRPPACVWSSCRRSSPGWFCRCSRFARCRASSLDSGHPRSVAVHSRRIIRFRRS